MSLPLLGDIIEADKAFEYQLEGIGTVWEMSRVGQERQAQFQFEVTRAERDGKPGRVAGLTVELILDATTAMRDVHKAGDRLTEKAEMASVLSKIRPLQIVELAQAAQHGKDNVLYKARMRADREPGVEVKDEPEGEEAKN